MMGVEVVIAVVVTAAVSFLLFALWVDSCCDSSGLVPFVCLVGGLMSTEVKQCLDDLRELLTGEGYSAPSKLVGVTTKGKGAILHISGVDMRRFIDDVSRHTEDLGFKDCPDGIWVWEGRLHTSHTNTPDAYEWDSDLVGSFRSPTEEEWLCIRKGQNPWPEEPEGLYNDNGTE